jgi:4-amino-4-deoxy-L-arabinose transferase-like glycosyltransferase
MIYRRAMISKVIINILNKLKKSSLPLGLLFIVFLIRLIFLFEFNNNCCSSDETAFHSIAVHLVNGNGYIYTSDDSHAIWKNIIYAYKPPLYPFFLAAVYKIFGQSKSVVMFFQIFISTITGLFIYLISLKCFSKKIATLSLIFFAVFWETAILPITLYSDNFYWFFLSALILLFVISKNFTFKLAIISGIILGLLTLIRPPSITLLIPLSIWFLLNKLNVKKIGLLCVIFLFCLLTIAPWTFRNYKIYHQLVFVYTEGYINLWMGNNAKTGGSYLAPDPKDPNETPKLHSKGPVQEIERDKFYADKTFSYILAHPIRTLDLDLTKAFMAVSLTNRAFITNNVLYRTRWIPSIPQSLAIDQFLLQISIYEFAILMICSMGTFIFFLINRKQLTYPIKLLFIFTIWIFLIIGFTHHEPYYTWQLYPMLIPLSAFSLTSIILALKKTRL